MKRYYIELNAAFVKDANSWKVILKHYEAYRKKYKNCDVFIYDSKTDEYLQP